jgi:hypothetical protein
MYGQLSGVRIAERSPLYEKKKQAESNASMSTVTG